MHKALPIMTAVTGSRLYGNAKPTSDWDFRGIVISAPAYYLGIDPKGFKGNGTYETLDPIDTSVFSQSQINTMKDEDLAFYDLKKFVLLAMNANPNILELLYCDQNLVPENPYWTKIRQHRHWFLSNRAKHSFIGYAYDQLKRLENHKEWLSKAPVNPKREDFGLPPEQQFTTSKIRALRQFSDEELANHFGNKEELAKFKAEYQWYQAKKNYEAFNKHKDERNPARYELEAKYGYDTKHGSHLVRLFYEAERLLKTGELIFPLPEIDIIREVRSGAWSYEQLIQFANEMGESLNTDHSVLPEKPEKEKLDELTQTIIWEYLKTVMD